MVARRNAVVGTRLRRDAFSAYGPANLWLYGMAPARFGLRTHFVALLAPI
jgi:hypothetical protein